MNRQNMEHVIKQQMAAIKDRKLHLLDELASCDIQLETLQKLLTEVGKRELELQKQAISKEITGDVPAGIHLDRKTTEKINIFLEFIDKCGDETVFRIAKGKMPKLQTVIYQKKYRLWGGWIQFREDLYRWINREGEYAGILEKREDDEP